MTQFSANTANNAQDIAQSRKISGAITDATGDGFHIFDGKFDHYFYGSGLTYQNGMISGGIITGYTLAPDTASFQQFTDIKNLSGKTLQEFISGHDLAPLIPLIFSGDDIIHNSIAADGTVTGYGGNDELWSTGGLTIGGDGNDTLVAFNGHVDGGAGLDTLKHPFSGGVFSLYTITHEDGWLHLVQPNQGKYGPYPSDVFVKNVERLKFENGTLALDTDGDAGQAYRLYQAAFNRTPDKEGLTFWVGKIDGGMSLHDVSGNFLASPEFVSIYGKSSSNLEFVNRLYSNILERDGEATGLSFWKEQLDHGTWSRADVLAYFSESPENTAKVAPAISDGIWLT